MKRVIFYGALGRKNYIPVGGGEVGNWRTINFLRDLGYCVEPFYRPFKNVWEKSMADYIKFAIKILCNYVLFSLKLLFSQKKDTIIHLSGFYGRMIFHELLLLKTAKLLGYKNIVYELRGGGFKEFYRVGTDRYKKKIKEAIDTATFVLSQGEENIPVIKEFSSSPVYLYPNCVTDDFINDITKSSRESPYKLLYIGRICEDKNIDIIIKATKWLLDHNYQVMLKIIGSSDVNYLLRLTDLINNLAVNDYIEFIGPQKHEKLKDYLMEADFFVFPSTNFREGQSNSLTEAMAYGLVPIASPVGFNASTIDNNDLIVDILSGEEYGKCIANVIDKSIDKYSDKMRNRIKECYSEATVKKILSKAYKHFD